MGYFAPPEVNRGLDLVTFVKYPGRMVFLEIVIMLVGARPEFYLLDGDDRLFSLGLLLLLLLLVLPLSEIDDTAHRRGRLRRDLDKVEAFGPRNFKSFLGTLDAQLRAIIIYDPDFARPDTLVYPNGRASVSPASLKPANIRSSRAKTPALKLTLLIGFPVSAVNGQFPSQVLNLSLRNPSCKDRGHGNYSL